VPDCVAIYDNFTQSLHRQIDVMAGSAVTDDRVGRIVARAEGRGIRVDDRCQRSLRITRVGFWRRLLGMRDVYDR
jgi:hypothetical protein